MAKAAVKEAPKAPEPEVQEETATETTHKSIVDAKYRDKYKKRSEWMADLLKEHASTFKTIPAKEQVGERGGDGFKEAVAERKVSTGVDVEALFKIGAENGLDLEKFRAQTDGHGFPGRFRMTVGNMLRNVAKQRHGFWLNEEFVEAPEDWLKEAGAPAEPTHEQDGTKIAKAKPALEPKPEPKPEPESKLIKKTETPPTKPVVPAKKGK